MNDRTRIYISPAHPDVELGDWFRVVRVAVEEDGEPEITLQRITIADLLEEGGEVTPCHLREKFGLPPVDAT